LKVIRADKEEGKAFGRFARPPRFPHPAQHPTANNTGYTDTRIIPSPSLDNFQTGPGQNFSGRPRSKIFHRAN
jgi:hypothetical protein